MVEKIEHEFVCVVWADAHEGEGSWSPLDPDDQSEHLVHTVGMLITDDQGGKARHVTIAQSKSPNDFYDHVIHIPVAMIRSICFLKAFTKDIAVDPLTV